MDLGKAASPATQHLRARSDPDHGHNRAGIDEELACEGDHATGLKARNAVDFGCV